MTKPKRTRKENEMNNTINRIKKRADILTDFFIERYERLEKENHKLLELHNQNYLKLRTHELAFEEALDKITKIEKEKDETITIIFKGKDNNGDKDTLYAYFIKGEPLYPLAEMLLEKHEKRKAFERLIEKGWTKPMTKPKRTRKETNK